MMRSKSFLKIVISLAIFSVFTWWSFRSLMRAPSPHSEVAVEEKARIPKAESDGAAPTESMARVSEFYQTESKRIGALDKDPILTEKRLREFSATLNDNEIRWLIGEAANLENNGDGRFFAVYLLALADSPLAFRVLSEFAVTAIPAQKVKGLEELERQLRGQAIEGLARACQKNREWKDSLLDVVSRQEDEFLRDRAHRGLYQCETGKSLAEQDQEALQKLRKASPKNR
jgi:hypothetical protein